MKNLHTLEEFLIESRRSIDSAFSKIDELPKGKLFDDAKSIEGVFKKSTHSWNDIISAYEKNEDQQRIVTIDLSDVRITQPNIQANKVDKMIGKINKLPRINVVQFPDGEKAIYDGHHRLIAQWALGEKKIKVNLVKL
jgi:hypothetical protein